MTNFYDTTPNKYSYGARDDGATLPDVHLASRVAPLGEEPLSTIEVSVRLV